MQFYNHYRLQLHVRTKTTFYPIYFVYISACKKTIQPFNSVSVLILASIQIFAVKDFCGCKGWTVNKCLKLNYMDGLETEKMRSVKGKLCSNISGFYTDLKYQDKEMYFPHLKMSKMS